MSRFEKFDEELPSKNKFYSYERIHKICNKFKMKTMKDYHNLYLKYDVFC